MHILQHFVLNTITWFVRLFGMQEEQKDALIGLARERDEFELCIKELRARNSWLEKQILRSPEALRYVSWRRAAAGEILHAKPISNFEIGPMSSSIFIYLFGIGGGKTDFCSGQFLFF